MGHERGPKIAKGGLSGAQAALAEAIGEALHKKRLEWAEAANVPMGRMLSNAAVGAIATKPPKDPRELNRREGVRGAFVREHGDEVLALIKELQEKSARGELPPIVELQKKDSRTRKREDKLKAWRTEKSKERKVTPSVVLSNLLVEDLAASEPLTPETLRAFPWFGEKRARLYTAELLALLAHS
jgi:ribonuclease D